MAGRLFALLSDGTPQEFRDWAQDYYEMPIDLGAVRHIYVGQPLTANVVTALNSATTPGNRRRSRHRDRLPDPLTGYRT